MLLEETSLLMINEDFKKRFVAEYYQVKIRAEKLANMIAEIDDNTLEFTPKCSRDLLMSQLTTMAEYKQILEKRAEIEGITLLDHDEDHSKLVYADTVWSLFYILQIVNEVRSNEKTYRTALAKKYISQVCKGMLDFEDPSLSFMIKRELEHSEKSENQSITNTPKNTISIKYFNSDISPIVKSEKGDWVDLRSAVDIDLKAGESALIPLGIGMKLPKDCEAIIAPRSSTFKNYKIIQTNSIGVIDNSYSGDNDEWKLPVYAVEDTHIGFNNRICQFRIQKRQPDICFCEVGSLDKSDRGGFGSTGVD